MKDKHCMDCDPACKEGCSGEGNFQGVGGKKEKEKEKERGKGRRLSARYLFVVQFSDALLSVHGTFFTFSFPFIIRRLYCCPSVSFKSSLFSRQFLLDKFLQQTCDY